MEKVNPMSNLKRLFPLYLYNEISLKPQNEIDEMGGISSVHSEPNTCINLK